MTTKESAAKAVQDEIDHLADMEEMSVVRGALVTVRDRIRALPDADGWQPIETAPEGEHIMLYWPEGEKGVGGIECATIYKTDYWSLTGYDYWTHGGPNAGLDWEPRNSEKPTYWHPLPKPPETQR